MSNPFLKEVMTLILRDLPVLPTKADVLDHYAKRMEELALALRQGEQQSRLPTDDAGDRELNAMWHAAMPAIDLQIGAARDAAAIVRQIAREERILSARAAANHAGREPTRG